MKRLSAVFLEQELFQNYPIQLALRGHDLRLTSGKIYQKSLNDVNKYNENFSKIGQELCDLRAFEENSNSTMTVFLYIPACLTRDLLGRGR